MSEKSAKTAAGRVTSFYELVQPHDAMLSYLKTGPEKVAGYAFSMASDNGTRPSTLH